MIQEIPKISDRIKCLKTKKMNCHKINFGSCWIIRYFGYPILKTYLSVQIFTKIGANFPCFGYFWMFENKIFYFVSDLKIFKYPIRNIWKIKKIGSMGSDIYEHPLWPSKGNWRNKFIDYLLPSFLPFWSTRKGHVKHT